MSRRMIYISWIALFLFVYCFIICGCVSPNQKLYNSVQSNCPSACNYMKWTGQITVEENNIQCVCVEE